MAWDGESISAPDYGTGWSVPTIKFSTCFGYVLSTKGKASRGSQSVEARILFPVVKLSFLFPLLLLHFLLAPLLFFLLQTVVAVVVSETSYRNTLESSASSDVTMSSIPSTFAKAFKEGKGKGARDGSIEARRRERRDRGARNAKWENRLLKMKF